MYPQSITFEKQYDNIFFKKGDKKDDKIKTCMKNYTSPLPSFLVGVERK